MNKMQFFIKWNRHGKWKCLMLFLVFAFAGTVISGALFVKQNNSVFYQTVADPSMGLVYQQADHVLSIFSLAGIMITVWGSFTLLIFKELSMEKTVAMCKIYGMKERDLIYKAFVDLLFYGMAAGILGGAGGYQLFRYLGTYVCEVDIVIRFFSPDTIGIVCKEFLMLCTIAFFGSLISGSFVYRKPVMNSLNQRKDKAERTSFGRIVLIGVLVLAAEACLIFFDSLQYILIIVTIAVITTALLYAVFHLIFSKRMNDHRKRTALKSMWGLSFRFLCSRSKKDAILAATISVGAILICFVMNIKFNFTGIITDSYRDNMGYSAGVRVLEWNEVESVKGILEEHGYQYTLLYSKLMPYGALYGMEGTEGEFWAAVVGTQTDGNIHFSLPEGTFAAENYFSAHLNIKEGDSCEVFGKKMPCERILSEVQALSLVSYNVLVNEKDWNFGLDSSWSPVFLMDLSKNQIKELREVLDYAPCEVETASMIADALQELFSKYISVVMIVGSMLALVTATFFYSMIRNDLSTRRTETFLYQVYGASVRKSKRIIYQEYMMIAMIASFSVVLVIMIFGEAFFLFFLHRHYPVSVLVVLVTTLMVAGFVMCCCIAAGKMDAKNRKIELIRDE